MMFRLSLLVSILSLTILNSQASTTNIDCPDKFEVSRSEELKSKVLHWDHDLKGPKIQITDYKSTECTNCVKVVYSGPLYDGCGGDCRITSYAYLMNKESGRIEKMCIEAGVGKRHNGEIYTKRETTLSRFDSSHENLHSYLSSIEINRMGTLGNTSEVLEFVDGKRKLNHKNVASISKAYTMHDAGNTVGTFVVHVNKVRGLLHKQKELEDSSLVINRLK
ncbi:hypothetical protein OAB57_00275 [Bacteriovoracaceae bacterium]|nr:hypothetical protein [Bacteriovoracaceae bacterium]